MESTLHLITYSFPLSVSGITHNGLSITTQIADHENGREALRRQRSQASGRRSNVRDYLEEEIKEEKVTKDLEDDHLSNSFMGFTAKAA